MNFIIRFFVGSNWWRGWDQASWRTTWKSSCYSQKFSNLKVLGLGTLILTLMIQGVWSKVSLGNVWAFVPGNLISHAFLRDKAPLKFFQEGMGLHVRPSVFLPIDWYCLNPSWLMVKLNSIIKVRLPLSLLRFSTLQIRLKSPRSNHYWSWWFW